MAVSCKSCDDLRTNAPGVLVNGIDDTACNSLKNDTGLNPSSGSNDCADLEDLNDCLVGNMEEEVDAYDVCDWKEFMKKFIANVYTVLKGIICAICGIWTRSHKQDCLIDYLFSGDSFRVGEEPTDGSYVVAGKGVSYLTRSQGQWATDIYLLYIGGALGRGGGSLAFHSKDWDDPAACYNFDNGANATSTSARKGNNAWATVGDTTPGNELIYEIRLKRSQFPTLKSIYAGFGQETNAGGFHCVVQLFEEGEYAYGQHGACDRSTGEPEREGASRGHLVETGYTYVQLRMTYIMQLVSHKSTDSGATDANTTAAVTPRYWVGFRFNRDGIEC